MKIIFLFILFCAFTSKGFSQHDTSVVPVPLPKDSPLRKFTRGYVKVKFTVRKRKSIASVEEINASGDTAAFRKYIERNLKGEKAAKNKARAGVYTVIVRFVADKEGMISDVVAETNHGYGMEEEAVRIIRKMTPWLPAQQDGTPIRTYRKSFISSPEKK